MPCPKDFSLFMHSLTGFPCLFLFVTSPRLPFHLHFVASHFSCPVFPQIEFPTLRNITFPIISSHDSHLLVGGNSLITHAPRGTGGQPSYTNPLHIICKKGGGGCPDDMWKCVRNKWKAFHYFWFFVRVPQIIFSHNRSILTKLQ